MSCRNMWTTSFYSISTVQHEMCATFRFLGNSDQKKSGFASVLDKVHRDGAYNDGGSDYVGADQGRQWISDCLFRLGVVH